MASALRALFVIDTPSQVFNLQEAVREYGIDDYDIITCDCCRADAYSQLQQLLTRLKPTHLIQVPRVSGAIEDRISIYAQHLPWLKQQGYQLVFFSNIRQQWQRDIVCSLSGPKLVLMDDGNAPLVFYRYLFSQGLFFDFPADPDTVRAQQALLARQKYQVCTQPPAHLELFTVFDLPALPWLSICKNPLQAMKQHFPIVDEQAVLLLGGGETQLSYLSEDHYIALLRKVVALFPGKCIHYVPHRITNPDFVARIRLELPVAIMQQHLPIEDWLRQQATPPATVVGFYSMALTTIAHCFSGLRVISVDPGLSTWINAASSHVWNLTRCNNLQVIEAIMDYLRLCEGIEINYLDTQTT
ncbi:hypothetical protein [Rheinheimera sp. 1928-s]|uniref:hypothetical protein n=1 Tax=Rheinheimera sp. 1928-s TaxID=3033803 RepID=UPI002616CAA6|nr:hypothetical protein [Rheinheimera sp. 1928-s]MDF3125828.1 hypothetical protein [Rheinheimera sp. 1928-s]